MENMITVRNETIDDMEGIRVVDEAAIATLRQTYRPNKKAICNKSIVRMSSKRIVAVFGSTIVGTAGYFIEKRSLRVIGLGVHPNYRRRGVARELIEFLERICTGEGLCSLNLHTVKQTGNVEIFKRLGFYIVSEQIDDFSESKIYPVLIDVQMEKQI